MSNLYTPNGGGASLVGADGKTPLGRGTLPDARMERIKLVAVSPHFVGLMFSRTGAWEYIFENWPEGCEVLGSTILPSGEFAIVVYRNDFPRITQGMRPEVLVCSVRQRPVADRETYAGVDEGC